MKHYDKHYCADESAHDAGHCYLNAVKCNKFPHTLSGDGRHCAECGIDMSVDAERSNDDGSVMAFVDPATLSAPNGEFGENDEILKRPR